MKPLVMTPYLEARLRECYPHGQFLFMPEETMDRTWQKQISACIAETIKPHGFKTQGASYYVGEAFNRAEFEFTYIQSPLEQGHFGLDYMTMVAHIKANKIKQYASVKLYISTIPLCQNSCPITIS